MKTFFVLCATVSVIQVIFIGESSAQADNYQDYTPQIYGQDRRSASPQNDRRFTRPQLAAGRRFEPENFYEQDGLVDERLPRSRSYMEELQYPQMSPRFNNNYNGNNRGLDLLGNAITKPLELVGQVGSLLGNNLNNIHRIASNGIRNLSDLGDGITNSVLDNMDSRSRMFNSFRNDGVGILNNVAQIPTRFMRNINGSLPSFNDNNQYQNELANARRLAGQFIPKIMNPYQENYQPRRQYPIERDYQLEQEQDAYYEPDVQLPSPLPQRKIQNPLPVPSQSTLEQLPENAKKVVAPLSPAKKRTNINSSTNAKNSSANTNNSSTNTNS